MLESTCREYYGLVVAKSTVILHMCFGDYGGRRRAVLRVSPACLAFGAVAASGSPRAPIRPFQAPDQIGRSVRSFSPRPDYQTEGISVPGSRENKQVVKGSPTQAEVLAVAVDKCVRDMPNVAAEWWGCSAWQSYQSRKRALLSGSPHGGSRDALNPRPHARSRRYSRKSAFLIPISGSISGSNMIQSSHK